MKIVSFFAGAGGLDLGFEKAYSLPPINVSQLDLQKKYDTWQ